MFNSAMIASLEDVAQTLEVTCDEVMRYLETQHWKIALEHGATKNTTDIAVNMEEWLDLFTHNDLREDLKSYGDNTKITWVKNKIDECKKTGKTSWEWLGVFKNPQEEITVLENILQEFA